MNEPESKRNLKQAFTSMIKRPAEEEHFFVSKVIAYN